MVILSEQGNMLNRWTLWTATNLEVQFQDWIHQKSNEASFSILPLSDSTTSIIHYMEFPYSLL